MGVMLTISIVLNILGLGSYINQHGINYESLMVFCLCWGMGGSFISLLLSKTLAKWTMKLQIIQGHSSTQMEERLYSSVQRLSQAAGLAKMPEVAIYESPELNAFATGPSRNNSLVAVSTGLLNRMNADEVEGVLAHEVSHIANGDMVTMTLVQGIINAFVLFFAKIIAWGVANAMSRDENESPSYFLVFAIEIACQIAFSILGSIIVNWFSRFREYKADAGAAKLVGSQKMIAALQNLQSNLNIEDPHSKQQEAIASLKISGRSAFMELFSTHPPLALRIDKLKKFSR